VFATYTVSDPSGEPGSQWRALILFGDGQKDGPVIPFGKGDGFAFEDTHTYNSPGVYTVTIMIALPGSGNPNDNTVTTRVTVARPTPSPTPSPTPTPTQSPTSTQMSPPITVSSIKQKVRANRTFHGRVAGFKVTDTKAQTLRAIIDWGDRSLPTPGHIRSRGKGRFAVFGTHRYIAPGVAHVNVTIVDSNGRTTTAESSMRVVR
jgi:hypothetical protein